MSAQYIITVHNVNSLWTLVLILKTTVLNTLVMMTITTDVKKQQKLAYHMFTCKFPASYIRVSADHDNVMMRQNHKQVIFQQYGEQTMLD